MTRRQDTDIQPVLRAGMALVAANGLRGLSLRPLAEQLKTTVSALSHRFGLKDALVGKLIDAAREEDGAFLDIWLARIRAVDVRDGPLMADFADAILAEMAGPERLRTQFYCELLQGVVSRPEIAAPLGVWRCRRADFWRAATEGLGQPHLGEMLHAYSTNEAAHGLALDDLAAYRWLRRLNLHRLCCRLEPAASELRQFEIFHAAMGDLLEAPGRYQVPAVTEWHARLARHISAVIIAEGADAVTHREIAARAGLASSTLAYRFPRQEDLLKAGLNDIIARVHGVVADLPPGTVRPEYELTTAEIARATFALSLAATRMPDLKAFAADLRRRRGENYAIRLNSRTPAEAPFDLLSVQAISMTGVGRLMLDAEIDPAPDAATYKLVERVEAMHREGR